MRDRSIHTVNRQFLNLWSAQGISRFGDALLEITLPVWVGLATKSPIQVAGVAAAELLPAILVGPIAGVFAERFSPKMIMVLMDMLRACIVLLLLEFHGANTTYLAYIVGFLLSLGTRLFVPAQAVLIRRIIRGRDIQKMQGGLHVASRISLTLGPALGGTLLLSIGPSATVVIDAGTFVVSTIFLLKIQQENDGPEVSEQSISPTNVSSIKRDVVVGLRYLVESPSLVIAALVTAILTLTGFIWFAVDVFYVKSYLSVPGEAVGYLWTVSGLGDLLAGLVIFRLASKLNPIYLITGGLFIRAISLIFYSVVRHFGSALPICLAAGFGDGITAIALSTMAMQYSPPSLMGRVSSTLDMVGQFSGLGAAALIAAMGSRFTSQQDLLACGMLLFVTAMLALFWTWWMKTPKP